MLDANALCVCGHSAATHTLVGGCLGGAEHETGCLCRGFAAATLNDLAPRMMAAAQGAGDAMGTAAREYLAAQPLSDEERLQAFVIAAHSVSEAAKQGWNAHLGAKRMRQVGQRQSPN